MDSGLTYIIGLVWLFTFSIVLHIKVPVVDTGIPAHAEKYDSKAQIEKACTKFLGRVD